MLVLPSLPPGLRRDDVTEDVHAVLRESARRSLLHRAPRTVEELYYYLGRVHEFWLARRAVCAEHSSPLEFIARAYFHSDPRLFALAAKGSGKTQALALLHMANSRFKPKCWTAHMGATQKQADYGYRYLQTEVGKPEIEGEVLGKPTRNETNFANGSMVTVLTGTISQACLPGSQGVITEHGLLRMDAIVNRRMVVKVKSYNFELGQWEWCPVTDWYDHGPESDFMALSVDVSPRRGCPRHRILTATGNHGIMRPDGSRTALVDLRPGDDVCVPGYVFSPDEKQVLLGLMLGDGHVDKNGRLCVVHGLKQRDYLAWMVKVFAALTPTLMPHRGFGEGVRMRTKAHPDLMRLRERWYGTGIKRVPDDIVGELGPLGLAVWLMDDGGVTNGHWRISTDGFSRAEQETLATALMRFGVNPIIEAKGKAWTIRLRVADSRALTAHVAGFLEASNKVKRWMAPHVISGHSGIVRLFVASVTPVTRHGKRARRYDLGVDRTHNFCVGSGLLVSNSGPHEQIGVVDELDQLDYDVWQHFNKTPHEADGIPAQLVLASTRFLKHGTVNRIIEDLGTRLKTVAWCTWDAMAPCPHQCDNVPDYARSTPEDPRCPMFSRKTIGPEGNETEEIMCGGKAHQGTGHLSFDEVLNQFLVSDARSFDILQGLKEPGSEGMFFPECSDLAHVKAEYEYVPGQPVYLAYDDGFTFPHCLGAWQMRPDGVLYQFDEHYGTKTLARDLCENVLPEKPWLKDVEYGWPDPNGRPAIEEFRRFFLATIKRPVMVWDVDNARVDGWKVVRRRLRNQLGQTTIGFHPRCKETWKDLKGLVAKEGTEDCEKVRDHGADQVRYLVRNLERFLGIRSAWDREEQRPEGAVERVNKAREVLAEAEIRDRWDRLKGIGVKETHLKDLEARFGVDRIKFSQALGAWISENTMGGRLRRAGLADDENDERRDE